MTDLADGRQGPGCNQRSAAELRKIERDLHDGAQARLVALGMNLRAVERMLPDSPQAALGLVAEARETSLRALNELRDLIRGICPPVLADRGLGHASRRLPWTPRCRSSWTSTCRAG